MVNGHYNLFHIKTDKIANNAWTVRQPAGLRIRFLPNCFLDL